MRYRILWAVSLVAVVALSLVNWSGRAQEVHAWKTWEYKIVQQYGANPMNPSLGEKELNHLGVEGWELIEVRSGNAGTGQFRTDYHFKRNR